MKRKKICVVTGSRADYGLLYWLMRLIDSDNRLVLQMVVTGAHLSRKHGYTYRNILKDGFKVSGKVDLRLVSDADYKIAISAGYGVAGFAENFNRLKPDVIVLLGDRYEMLAASVSSVLQRTPIAHIHGGEITEGAYDDAIRHAITKMAYLHFVSHKDYARRVMQMGESPDRIFTVGALGLDGIKRLDLLDKDKLEKLLGFKLGIETALVTFHPVTMQRGKTVLYVRNMLKALGAAGIRCIITLPNADAENGVIFKEIKRFIKRYPEKSKVYASLGQLKYYSAMKHCGFIIGNSSSGIIEAPSFKLPVINIGDRQKGRIRTRNVIDISGSDVNGIYACIKKAISSRFRQSLNNLSNPFGDGEASLRIKSVLKKTEFNNIQKEFIDLR